MLLNDAVRNGETEASPFLRAFRGEERIVDAMNVLGVDAVPAVEHVDPHAAVAIARSLHFEYAPRRHCVARIDEQIEKHLLQLARITGDSRRARVELRANVKPGR